MHLLECFKAEGKRRCEVEGGVKDRSFVENVILLAGVLGNGDFVSASVVDEVLLAVVSAHRYYCSS